MSDTIWSWVLFAMALALFPLLTWGASKLVSWVNAKAKFSKLMGFLAHVTVLVDGIVGDVTSALSPDIAAAVADGKVTPEERKTLKDKTLKLLVDSLGTRGLAEARATLGIAGPLLDGWLSGLVTSHLTTKLSPVAGKTTLVALAPKAMAPP